MSWMTTPMLDRLEKYLDLAAFRQTLVASNLANIDTPGYRTQDIDFESEMRRALALQPPLPTQPVVREVPGLIERPDGNNVSVERETVLLGQTQLQFRAGVQLLRMELGRLRTAIKEGS
ncbi:MAG TPA: flagellar basal body protein [Terriglobia bacterium]|jgi:flagellar basal-body rod protein FlgB|nr:flagellar basal body protein [Terriglobia bacterium]